MNDNQTERRRNSVFLTYFDQRKLRDFFTRIDFKIAAKIALTALISLYLWLELDHYLKYPEMLTPGIWCVVASIVVLQTNIGGTYKAIWNQFVGVLIGSFLGALFAVEFGARTEMIALAVFLTIIFCSILGIPESYRIASISVVFIMIPLKLHPAISPWGYSLMRFLETCLGFLVAVIVSHLLWPSQSTTKLRLNLADTTILLRQYFEHLLISKDSPKRNLQIIENLTEEIDLSLAQSSKTLEESKMELLLRFAPVEVWVNLLHCQGGLWESLKELQNVFKSSLDEVFDDDLKKLIHQMIETTDLAFIEIAHLLKRGKSTFDFNRLDDLLIDLEENMARFRSTHTLKKYHLDVVEDYFVFLYQFKQILNALKTFYALLLKLQEEK